MTTEIFVFGSNLAGRHGLGSAKRAAMRHGAQWGCGVGRMGMSYAIPTKDRDLKTMPLEKIKPFIRDFVQYAEENPDITFKMVEIGCGLAGYEPWQIAPMFYGTPPNVILPPSFARLLKKDLYVRMKATAYEVDEWPEWMKEATNVGDNDA